MSLSNSKSVAIYPYPHWESTLLLCIDRAIKRAWDSVLTNEFKKLPHYSEEEITDALEYEIQKIMDMENESGFNRSKFQSIVRGAKFRSFDDAHLEKAPDLLIRQIDLSPGIFDSRHDSLFIECKIIEGRNKPPLLYIKNGIRRFVDGEYAWCMSHSIMIAYVRDGKKIPKDIKETFKRNSTNTEIARCAPLNNEYSKWIGSKSPQTYRTTHSRLWKQPKHGAPNNIEISHIWLKCP